MPKYSKADQERALEQMRKWLKPGDTLHTILDHVSKSGMTRHIRLVILRDGEALHPNWSAACILGYSQAKRRDGIVMTGCGMDMGFSLVYSLSHRLFPDGFGIEGELIKSAHKARPSTKEEAADMVARGYTFHGRNGDASGWDNDGGYALKHRWL